MTDDVMTEEDSFASLLQVGGNGIPPALRGGTDAFPLEDCVGG
jgi:hypothetical protein